MKTRAGLSLVIGACLFMAAGHAAAHDGYHRDSAGRGYYDVHYDVRVYRGHSMPRWLKRHRGFRHWYRNSRYRYNRRLAWEGLWDIYRWERRYGRRYELRIDLHDHRYRGRHRHRNRHH